MEGFVHSWQRSRTLFRADGIEQVHYGATEKYRTGGDEPSVQQTAANGRRILMRKCAVVRQKCFNRCNRDRIRGPQCIFKVLRMKQGSPSADKNQEAPMSWTA